MGQLQDVPQVREVEHYSDSVWRVFAALAHVVETIRGEGAMPSSTLGEPFWLREFASRSLVIAKGAAGSLVELFQTSPDGIAIEGAWFRSVHEYVLVYAFDVRRRVGERADDPSSLAQAIQLVQMDSQRYGSRFPDSDWVCRALAFERREAKHRAHQLHATMAAGQRSTSTAIPGWFRVASVLASRGIDIPWVSRAPALEPCDAEHRAHPAAELSEGQPPSPNAITIEELLTREGLQTNSMSARILTAALDHVLRGEWHALATLVPELAGNKKAYEAINRLVERGLIERRKERASVQLRAPGPSCPPDVLM